MIEKSGSISLTGPLSRNERVMKLKGGDSLPVRVLQRYDSNSALLDLRGNKVRADFPGGVPRESEFRLVLIGNDGEKLHFRLPAGSSQDGKSFISPFDSDLTKNELFQLSKNSSLIKSIFSYSAFIIRMRDGIDFFEKRERRKRCLDTLNLRIKDAGLKRMIPLLLLNSERDLYIYSALMTLLKEESADEKDADKLFESLNKDDLAMLAEIIAERNGDSGFVHFVDGDELKEAAYFSKGDSLIISFDLSCLGHVDSVIRGGDAPSVDIYVDSADARNTLLSDADFLLSKLADAMGERLVFRISVTSDALQKIIAINDSVKFNRTIDMKA